MDETKMVVILLGVFFVIVIILAMQGLLPGEWTTIGQEIAPFIMLLTVFGVVIFFIFGYVRR